VKLKAYVIAHPDDRSAFYTFVAKDNKFLELAASGGAKCIISGDTVNCQSWLYRLLARSVYVVSSDICDYEVRRGLELALYKNPHVSGLSRLDALAQIVDFLPTERVVLQRAAKIWAEARITCFLIVDVSSYCDCLCPRPSKIQSSWGFS
jgi:hypothetical protein